MQQIYVIVAKYIISCFCPISQQRPGITHGITQVSEWLSSYSYHYAICILDRILKRGKGNTLMVGLYAL